VPVGRGKLCGVRKTKKLSEKKKEGGGARKEIGKGLRGGKEKMRAEPHQKVKGGKKRCPLGGNVQTKKTRRAVSLALPPWLKGGGRGLGVGGKTGPAYERERGTHRRRKGVFQW